MGIAAIKNFVRTQSAAAVAGVKSGLNNTQLHKIAGIRQLSGAGRFARGTIKGLQNPNLNKYGRRLYAMDRGMKGLRGAGKYFGATDMRGQGWRRAGAIGTRAGMGMGAMAAADFMNPFGLGWND